MFEKIRKMKNRKGFTLVELIVVLVILAILAALLIPAMTGYIDKANEEKVIAECRMATMAAQTEASVLDGTDGERRGLDQRDGG
ncbi:MAG: prepilin-type N-terminal cleavage/methylation domain-containing protein [Gemmiger formicilis]|uniref:prepilin-type N-terminal cleavage/methylation domain-containing protein n=1 Tax=Gemmiger formicilis TaxID=745368 RepID=UPI0039A387A7